MLAADFTAPLTIDEKLIFVSAGRERQGPAPMAVGAPYEWKRVNAPIIEAPRQEHSLRVGSVARKVYGF